jgi:hypothetical protein
MSDSELRWQDEILQLLYWMRGENLGAEPTCEDINRLLNLEPTQLATALGRLVALGLVQTQTVVDQERFALTARGIEEGKRRFYEEFSSSLGKESHIECGELDCDCHSPGWDGVCHSSEKR